MGERTPASTLASPRAAGYFLLAAALGAFVGARWERRTVQDTSRPAAPHQAPVLTAGLTPVTELSTIAPERVPIRDGLRDLFDFAESPEERAIRIEEARRAKIVEMRRARELADAMKREVDRVKAQHQYDLDHPEPPAVTLRLLGKMGSPKQPLAILASADGEVHFVRSGETVADDFTLLELGFESATIGYAEALVASHPEWKSRKTVIRMGAR